MGDDCLVVRVEPLEESIALEVPEDYVAHAVAGADELAVRGELDFARIARDVVTCETLLAILLEIGRREDEDLVVERLHGEPFLRRVDPDSGHAVHVRFGDVFDDDGNIVVPASDGLVVGGRDEASRLVDESDGAVVKERRGYD